MRNVVSMVLIACLSASASGQGVSAGTGPVPKPGSPSTGTTAPASAGAEDGSKSEEVLAAEKLIGEMVQAYRGAPALIDRIEAQFKMPGMEGEEPTEFVCRFDQAGNVHLVNPPYEFYAYEGNLYVMSTSIKDRMVKTSLVEGDILKTMWEKLKGRPTLSIHSALRLGRPLEDIVYALKFDMPMPPRLSRYRIITDNDGQSYEQVTLISPIGHTVVNVDPETKFIKFVETEYEPPGAPGGFKMKRHWRFHPEAMDALSEPIEVDEGARTLVSDMRELFGLAPQTVTDANLKVKVGEAAPDFTLFTLEGESVTLSELRGSAVVLDFWSTWCVPCRRSLPMLQQFSDWASSSGKPIKVVPVNVLERGDSHGEKWEKALEYWQREDFAMQSLFDPSREVAEAFGITVLPTTVIVDPRGRISTAHMGFDPEGDLLARLRNETEAALKAGSSSSK